MPIMLLILLGILYEDMQCSIYVNAVVGNIF